MQTLSGKFGDRSEAIAAWDFLSSYCLFSETGKPIRWSPLVLVVYTTALPRLSSERLR